MTIAEILALARERGIELAPQGPGILLRGNPGTMTEDLEAAIVENKAQLLQLLRGEHPNLGIWPIVPEGWTWCHPLAPCVLCELSTTWWDPAGAPRHPWCAELR